MENLSFYAEFAMVVAAAMIGLGLARVFNQPAILGYIIGGILISPFTWGPSIQDVHHFDELAEIGVILLMFSVGAEFSLRDLASVKWLALIGTPLAVALITGLVMLFAPLFGWSLLQGAVIGASLAVTSTMILARVLLDRGQLKSGPGKVTVGLSLVEDMIVVVLVVLIPVLATFTPDAALEIGFSIGRAILILGPVLLLSYKFVPWLLEKAGASQSGEFLLLTTLALCLIAAAATELLGLSLALGAFFAGLLISGSGAGHRALDKLGGLRDICVAIFFVCVGALIDPIRLLDAPWMVFFLTVVIVGGKFVIWYGVGRLFRLPHGAAFQCGILLTQIGEFSYILASVALTAAVIGPTEYNAILAASLISILINSQLTRILFRETDRAAA